MPMSGSLLLDTSVVIAIFRHSPEAERLVNGGAKTFLPVPALGELFNGVPRSRHPDLTLAQITSFTATVEILSCDAETARIYGDIKHDLWSKGRPLPENDMWIAAIARQHGLTVATRDAHFDQIVGLPVEKV
ncbi:MAG TPA: type II toxin-antitoxin system VapC family toxin [Longimicrobium sp.]